MQQIISTTTTITPNFQIHIPVEIRKALNLTTHGKAEILAIGDEIVIRPAKKSKIMKLSRSLNAKKTLDIDNIRDSIDYSKI
jgi:AbrB family looped-hinge helix DNA binding protein